jgi:hypothetical protein
VKLKIGVELCRKREGGRVREGREECRGKRRGGGGGGKRERHHHTHTHRERHRPDKRESRE